MEIRVGVGEQPEMQTLFCVGITDMQPEGVSSFKGEIELRIGKKQCHSTDA